MSEIAGGILFLVWAGLIVLGLVPELGARVGGWLRGGSLREPAPPPTVKKTSAEEESHIGQNLDRFV